MPDDPIDRVAMRAELSADEGRELKIYFDTKKIPSIGVGRNLRDVGISDAECDAMLDADINRTITTLDREAAWWRRLPEPQRRVLLNLCFNMGWATLVQFRDFRAAMQLGEWRNAADALEDSLWWQQVGARGPRMVARLTGGVV